MKPADSIAVSVLVPVAPEVAFEAFTEDVDLWWRRGPAFRQAQGSTMRFEPGVGGRLVEVLDGGGVREVGRLTAWEPARRLAFVWTGGGFRGDPITTVVVEFRAEAGGTRVEVEHSGWSALPPDHPVRHGQPDAVLWPRMGQWWHAQITSLRQIAQRERDPKDPTPPHHS